VAAVGYSALMRRLSGDTAAETAVVEKSAATEASTA
jgi:hypothetical protein